jgi:phage tail tape-measure protein
MSDETTDMRVEHAGEANLDPISGRAGSHPVGTGTGAAGGAAAGAFIGSVVGGPVGFAAGGAVGAVVGGLAGKGVAEAVNPTDEDAYWRENYGKSTYAVATRSYDIYRPAYQYGWESRARFDGKQWEEIEPSLRAEWERERPTASLTWDEANPAARDAWNRVSK